MPEENKLVLLSGMAMLLQSCVTEDELFDIAYWYFPALYKGRSGAIYLAEEAGKPLVKRLAWGQTDLPEQVSDICPAVQSGIPENIRSSFSSKVCKAGGREMYCVPFRESQAVFGMLCLEGDKETSMPEFRGVAFIAAEYMTLAVANLRLRRSLYQMALRDELTQLYNRRHMEDVLAKEIHRAKRLKTTLGMVMVDIDHFKRVNDSFGHAAGDWVLKMLADMLVSGVRNEDFVFRLGGEEFLILFTSGNLDNYIVRAEHIRTGIAGTKLSWEGRQIGQVTVSMGVAAFPEHADSVDRLLHQADLALYRAKNSGRNLVVAAEDFNKGE